MSKIGDYAMKYNAYTILKRAGWRAYSISKALGIREDIVMDWNQGIHHVRMHELKV